MKIINEVNMFKKIIISMFLAVALIAAGGSSTVFAQTAPAKDASGSSKPKTGGGSSVDDSGVSQTCIGAKQAQGKDKATAVAECNDKDTLQEGLGGFIKKVIDILLFLVGAIAVIMLIVGGIRYVVSGGDSAQTTAAKNTILYAIIGIVVAMMAYAIVHWVIGGLGSS